jgi:hypothetical protein
LLIIAQGTKNGTLMDADLFADYRCKNEQRESALKSTSISVLFFGLAFFSLSDSMTPLIMSVSSVKWQPPRLTN